MGLPMGYFLHNQLQTQPQSDNPLETQNQNTKIFCYAIEAGTSDWQKEEGFPVLSSYSVGAENYSTSQVNFGVSISNNNSISLFNVEFEVSYRTAENEWNTTTKANIGFLDIQQSKHSEVTLTNPYLSLWQTRRPDYRSGETIWENVTVYVLDANDCKITAYGFAKP